MGQERGGDDDLPRLDGEDPETPYREDMEHWVAVYEELVSFCEWLLASPPTSPGDADQARLLVARREHALRRLNYWRSRLNHNVETRDRSCWEGA